MFCTTVRKKTQPPQKSMTLMRSVVREHTNQLFLLASFFNKEKQNEQEEIKWNRYCSYIVYPLALQLEP